jgi:hypothetical protein
MTFSPSSGCIVYCDTVYAVQIFALQCSGSCVNALSSLVVKKIFVVASTSLRYPNFQYIMCIGCIVKNSMYL